MLDIKQVITPNVSGRGSLRSMPIDYLADKNTGSVSMVFPLMLSESRALTPKLSLSYHVNQGNSVFGIGCDLNGLLSISRSVRKGVPYYDDALDSFILSNQGELVKTGTNADATIVYYRPRTESAFSTIEYHVMEKYWLIREANGINHYLGEDDSSCVSDLEVGIFQWCVNRSVDAHGNVILYTYVKQHQAFYIQHIDYGNYQHASGETRFAFRCRFDYGEEESVERNHEGHALWVSSPERPDQFTHYQAGFAIATRTLCRRILLYHYFEDQERLAKYWELEYQLSPALSLIYKIQEKACRVNPIGKYVVEALPPVIFDYTPLDNAEKTLSDFNLESTVLPQAEGTYQWVDLYRDGLPGILYHDGNVALYWRSESGGRFSTPKVVSPYIKDASFEGELHARIMPLGEEKRTAWVVSDDEAVGYYLVDEEALSEGEEHYHITLSKENQFKALPFAFTDPMSDVMDVNGDGRNDVVLLNDTYPHFYPELEGVGEGYGLPKPLFLPPDFPRSAADPYAFVGFVDIFGDGLLHRVKVTQDGIDIWPNVGHGKFLQKIHWALPLIPGDIDPACLFFADVDGSGASDFVYATSDFLLVFLNQGNGFQKEARRLRFPEKYTHHDQLLLGDFLGQGVNSVVFIKRDAKENRYYMGSFAERKPYLLTRLIESSGLQTEFHYTTTTASYLADRDRVDADHKLLLTIRLPFVLPVLQTVVTLDPISHVKITKRYNYHHGVYDFVERRFCGFAYVEERMQETLLVQDASEMTGFVKNSVIKQWFYNRAHQEAARMRSSVDISLWVDNDLQEPLYYKESEDPSYQARALVAISEQRLSRELAYCLNGRLLKIERWAEEKEMPASVLVMHYNIRCDQQPTSTSRGVFVIQERQSYALDYSGVVDEPRVSREINVSFDEYNHVLRELKINYGRRLPLSEATVLLDDITIEGKTAEKLALGQSTHAVLLQQASYTAINDRTFNFLHLSVENHQYDLSQEASMLLSSQAMREINVWYERSSRLLLTHTRQYYWDDRQESAAVLGNAGEKALLHHQEVLAGDAEQMQRWHQPLLQSSETIEALLASCGYLFQMEQWWKPNLVTQFGGAEHYYQIIALVTEETHTARGMFHRTEVRRDKYQLLVERVLQYLDTEKVFAHDVLFDYQTLQPFRVIDPNQNTQVLLRDGFGRVTAHTKYGQCEGEWVGNPVTETPHIPLTRDVLEILSFEWCVRHHGLSVATLTESPESITGPWLGVNYYIDNPASRCVIELMRHTYAQSIRPLITETISPVGISIYYLDSQDNILQAKHKTYHLSESQSWLGSGIRVYSHNKLLLWQSLPAYSESFNRDSSYINSDPRLYNYYDENHQLVLQRLPDGHRREWQRAAWYEICYDQNAAIKKHNPSALLPAAQIVRFYNGQGLVVGYLTIQSSPGENQHLLHTTHYDVLGRVIAQQDARLTRPNVIIQYDLSGKVVARDSADRGIECYVYNYQNTLLRKKLGEWSQLYEVDSWQRPLSASVYSATSPVTEIEKRVYGESIADAAQLNACGQVVEYCNEEGLLHSVVFDFNGHCLHQQRHVFLPKIDARIGEVMRGDAEPHTWSYKTSTELWQEEIFSYERQYNAVGNVLAERLPQGALCVHEYNALLQVENIRVGRELDALTVVAEGMQYHAAGFRTDWRCGNGLVTHHEYDTIAQRLTRIHTQNARHDILQDQTYEFDPVGNITRIQCGALQLATTASSIKTFSAHALQYAYDDLYRLSVAQGVELRRQGILSNHKNITHQLFGEDGAVQVYTQRFAYDTGNNLTKMAHEGVNPWVLDFAVEAGSNRFSHLTDTKDNTPLSLAQDALYDAAGNMRALDADTTLQWDHTNQLRHVSTKGDASDDKVEEYYAYRGRAFQEVGFMDAPGAQERTSYTPGFFGKAPEKKIDTKPFAEYANRLYKITCFENATGIEIVEQLFLGSYERKRIFSLTRSAGEAQLILLRHSTRVADEEGTFATWHQFERDDFARETSSAAAMNVWRYTLADHLHSSCVECDEEGFVTGAEVYQPYGQSSFVMTRDTQQLRLKDYHYSGKMRDKITGLYYYGARYYAPQFGRWLSPDPAGLIDTLNLYAFVGNNPLTSFDEFGFSVWGFISNRIEGVINTAVGLGELGAAYAIGFTGVGLPLAVYFAARGADHLQAGVRNLVTGKHADTVSTELMKYGLEKAGLDEGEAEKWALVGELSLDLLSAGASLLRAKKSLSQLRKTIPWLRAEEKGAIAYFDAQKKLGKVNRWDAVIRLPKVVYESRYGVDEAGRSGVFGKIVIKITDPIEEAKTIAHEVRHSKTSLRAGSWRAPEREAIRWLIYNENHWWRAVEEGLAEARATKGFVAKLKAFWSYAVSHPGYGVTRTNITASFFSSMVGPAGSAGRIGLDVANIRDIRERVKRDVDSIFAPSSNPRSSSKPHSQSNKLAKTIAPEYAFFCAASMDIFSAGSFTNKEGTLMIPSLCAGDSSSHHMTSPVGWGGVKQ